MPPMTAMASGCSICDPAPIARARGSMPAAAAKAVISDGAKPAAPGLNHGGMGRDADAAEFLVGIEQQDAVFGHDADDHNQSHERRDVKRYAR